MSLAMYAAPFDNENNQINDKDNDNHIAKKKMANNRTQKRVPKENNYSEKVNTVLQTIHNLPYSSSSLSSSDGLADFNPIPPPMSVGVEQTRIRENTPTSGQTSSQTLEMGHEQSSSQDDSLDGQNYYKRFMPNYNSMYKNSAANMPYYSGYNNSNQTQGQGYPQSENNILLEKLNYMIHLLEEQQDEKTNNVTEEVVLYCFLGIFIIFIADSFVRVGKYVL
jgi:hypothetical protein